MKLKHKLLKHNVKNIDSFDNEQKVDNVYVERGHLPYNELQRRDEAWDLNYTQGDFFTNPKTGNAYQFILPEAEVTAKAETPVAKMAAKRNIDQVVKDQEDTKLLVNTMQQGQDKVAKFMTPFVMAPALPYAGLAFKSGIVSNLVNNPYVLAGVNSYFAAGGLLNLHNDYKNNNLGPGNALDVLMTLPLAKPVKTMLQTSANAGVKYGKPIYDYMKYNGKYISKNNSLNTIVHEAHPNFSNIKFINSGRIPIKHYAYKTFNGFSQQKPREPMLHVFPKKSNVDLPRRYEYAGYADLKSGLLLPDLGHWDILNIIFGLKNSNQIDKATALYLEGKYVIPFKDLLPEQEQNIFKQFADEVGFDHILYNNKFEANGIGSIGIVPKDNYVFTSKRLLSKGEQTAKMSMAEKLGIPKGERAMADPEVLKNALMFAEKYGYKTPTTIDEIKNMYRQHNTFYRGVSWNLDPKDWPKNQTIQELNKLDPATRFKILASKGYPTAQRTWDPLDEGFSDTEVFVTPSSSVGLEYADIANTNSQVIALQRPFSFRNPKTWHIDADWRPSSEPYATGKGSVVTLPHSHPTYEMKVSTKHLIPRGTFREYPDATLLPNFLEGIKPQEIHINL